MAVVVALAAGLSLCIRYIPALSFIGSGYAIILCAVIAAGVGAALFPVEEEKP